MSKIILKLTSIMVILVSMQSCYFKAIYKNDYATIYLVKNDDYFIEWHKVAEYQPKEIYSYGKYCLEDNQLIIESKYKRISIEQGDSCIGDPNILYFTYFDTGESINFFPYHKLVFNDSSYDMQVVPIKIPELNDSNEIKINVYFSNYNSNTIRITKMDFSKSNIIKVSPNYSLSISNYIQIDSLKFKIDLNKISYEDGIVKWKLTDNYKSIWYDYKYPFEKTQLGVRKFKLKSKIKQHLKEDPVIYLNTFPENRGGGSN
jgi:hypothetical protein